MKSPFPKISSPFKKSSTPSSSSRCCANPLSNRKNKRRVESLEAVKERLKIKLQKAKATKNIDLYSVPVKISK